MPGFRRAQKSALAPGIPGGFEALERAFEGREWHGLDDSALAKGRLFDRRRRSVPASYAHMPSSEEEDSDGSDGSEDSIAVGTLRIDHLTGILPTEREEASLAGRFSGEQLVTPPHLTRENSGLPPTPPTLANSDDLDPRSDSVATNLQFADAVRNALHSQKSGLSTPGRQLPTPDPSPPGTSENLTVALHHTSRLHPPLVNTHSLNHYPSSRAESFHTAREDPNASRLHLPPGPSRLSTPTSLHQASESTGVRTTCCGMGVEPDGSSSPTPERQDQPDAEVTPTRLPRLRSLHRSRSPYQPQPTIEGDFSKHISYISDENDNESAASAEDLNNIIYKQIREDNVKRHSIMSNGSNTVPAGIYFAVQAGKDHKLRRTTKALSLRNVSGSDATSNRGSISSGTKTLRHKKALTVSNREMSPACEPNTSARRTMRDPEFTLGMSEMTKITQAAIMNGSATGPAEVIPSQKSPANNDKPSRYESRHHLRRSSHDKRIENALQQPPEPRLRRSSLEKRIENVLHQQSSENEYSASPTQLPLRHFTAHMKVENKASHVRPAGIGSHSGIAASSLKIQHVRPPILDSSSTRSTTSPNVHHSRHTSLDNEAGAVSVWPWRNLDPRQSHELRPSNTPFSISQFSDRTEVELCEATGVKYYPHHNESLVVLETLSQPMSGDQTTQIPPYGLAANEKPIQLVSYDRSPAHAPTPSIQVASPSVNPRDPPEPPAFKVIPPTPIEEVEDQLAASVPDATLSSRPDGLRRRESLANKARRYSENFIVQPLFGRTLSLKRNSNRAADDQLPRPTHLSPLWRPNYMWEGYDSDEEDDYYSGDDLDGLPYGTLPRGGDTSDVEEPKQRNIFPRSMSVRMPGFRGQGGFLLGNSLGLDRHGTNNRRHYIARKTSTGGMHTGSRIGYVGETKRIKSLRSKGSEDMLRQMVSRKPSLGVRALRLKMAQIRQKRRERAREKRQQALKETIQHGI